MLRSLIKCITRTGIETASINYSSLIIKYMFLE
jgi:hypothetical protein